MVTLTRRPQGKPVRFSSHRPVTPSRLNCEYKGLSVNMPDRTTNRMHLDRLENFAIGEIESSEPAGWMD